MICHTVRYDERSFTVVDRIERSVKRSEDGHYVWLGHPFRDFASEGLQNEGRPCAQIDVSPALLENALSHPQSGDPVCTLRNCDIVETPDGLKLVESANDDGSLLILLQVSKVIPRFKSKCGQVAEGFLSEYRYVKPSRHPARVQNKRIEERLLKLAPGESFDFSIEEPEVRVFGKAIHKGRERVISITNADGRVEVREVAALPLNVPDYSQASLETDLGVGAVSLVLGAFFGFVASPPEMHIACSAIGAAIGVLLFAAVQCFRIVAAKNHPPVYRHRSETR